MFHCVEEQFIFSITSHIVADFQMAKLPRPFATRVLIQANWQVAAASC
jgi:hypothetical protein